MILIFKKMDEKLRILELYFHDEANSCFALSETQ